MNKKIAGTFILVCGVIVLALEAVLTVMALVNGQALDESVWSVLGTFAVGAFLLYFGLYLRKQDKYYPKEGQVG